METSLRRDVAGITPRRTRVHRRDCHSEITIGTVPVNDVTCPHTPKPTVRSTPAQVLKVVRPRNTKRNVCTCRWNHRAFSIFNLRKQIIENIRSDRVVVLIRGTAAEPSGLTGEHSLGVTGYCINHTPVNRRVVGGGRREREHRSLRHHLLSPMTTRAAV